MRSKYVQFSHCRYMFHGGTNFGFKTGANLENGFRPQPTSYDYDAPINEAGDATPKLKAIRDVIAEFFPDRAKIPIPAPKQKMALGRLTLKRMFGLKEMRQLMRNLSVKSPYPLTFERVGHTFRGIVSRTDGVFEVFIEAKAQQTLSILVENQGRINYGDFIADPKGIVKNVTLDERTLTDWKMMPLDLSKGNWLRDPGALEKIHRQGGRSVHVHNDGLSVYATTFALPESQTAHDSFLRLSHWTKGVAFLNGFNLGRYWTPAGPQKTLYVPGVLFKQKDNILLIMELEVTRSAPSGFTRPPPDRDLAVRRIERTISKVVEVIDSWIILHDSEVDFDRKNLAASHPLSEQMLTTF
ncbi:hypothetical protein V5799_026492 [Amblyomma americanum]|uniref:Beta-galactosidase n=1 Tax=Amblyomma americanum TaxID=6943 RepID=A0AAQ4DIF4_AMBAM